MTSLDFMGRLMKSSSDETIGDIADAFTVERVFVT